MSALQCADLAGDRSIGEIWERKFCALAGRFGKAYTPHQIGRTKSAQAAKREGGGAGKYFLKTMPDVTVWNSPGEHHEIKHKDATSSGMFGLERYRLEALLWFAGETGQRVFYTIHDYGRQPDEARRHRKTNMRSVLEHWRTCEVMTLSQNIQLTGIGTSYVGGVPKSVDIHYWHESLFAPLTGIWT